MTTFVQLCYNSTTRRGCDAVAIRFTSLVWLGLISGGFGAKGSGLQAIGSAAVPTGANCHRFSASLLVKASHS